MGLTRESTWAVFGVAVVLLAAVLWTTWRAPVGSVVSPTAYDDRGQEAESVDREGPLRSSSTLEPNEATPIEDRESDSSETGSEVGRPSRDDAMASLENDPSRVVYNTREILKKIDRVRRNPRDRRRVQSLASAVAIAWLDLERDYTETLPNLGNPPLSHNDLGELPIPDRRSYLQGLIASGEAKVVPEVTPGQEYYISRGIGSYGSRGYVIDRSRFPLAVETCCDIEGNPISDLKPTEPESVVLIEAWALSTISHLESIR